MISFHSITKIYLSDVIALENISFNISQKEFVSIVGRSGSGKTTLLKLLLREERPTEGSIFFEGENLLEAGNKSLSEIRRRIGVVFQDYKLLDDKTAYENIAYAMEITGKSPEEINSEVPEILEIIELTDRANNFPKELSEGECQRISIARAIAHRPDVILADEPTGNLDPYCSQDIVRLLLKIYELGTTIVLATHDKNIVNKLKKRVITLENGKIIRDQEKGKFVL
ncbi:MAG: ATP-binding cassette domain-containing protein [Patescibacteria group bacterium]|nr:ATP-binding cassette domain-containing protein [Patescibacteria group bacterium]